MNILHFYKTSYPVTVGGIEQVIDQLASATQRYGVTSEVLSLSPKPGCASVMLNGYTSHYAPLDFQFASTGFSVSVISRFTQLAKKADIIHYHFPWPFMDVVHFLTRVKKPTVVTYHSDIVRQQCLLKVYWPLQRCFLQSVDRIVATSPNYLATSPVLGRFLDKVTIIPIGLDKTAYPPASGVRLSFWEKKFGRPFFLFVGVLRYYKGLHILIEAAKGATYPVVIVGAGPIERELKSQAAKRGLRNIHFLGYLPMEDKIALLTLCYGVVFPSHLRSEAFGISLLEGAMFGKPMISSEIGTGTTFINIGDKTGLVVPPSDPKSLRHAMDYLVKNPDKAAAMGKKAEERYGRYFTAERMVRSYVDLYRTLLML